ncbi:2-deoxy-D-gluconate 3-dehydrogenase [Spirochaetia bacterium]|nr:2-deoxy-D-gluconate 3-dehydrogenase [Spirochaetia bacterium]
MKKYAILGASSDIGRCLVQQLNEKEENSSILAHYRSAPDPFINMTLQNNNCIKTIRSDLSTIAGIEAITQAIESYFDCPTHILHLCANKFEYMKFKDFDWNLFMYDFELQIHSIIKICKIFIPKMLKLPCQTKIVFMLSSCVFDVPPKFMSSYIISKYALLGTMKALASEYSGKNININAVSPSMIETKFLDNIDKRFVEINAGKSVGGRNADVSEIVPVMRFLLSDESNYMHGVNLNVSNGNVM